MIIVQTFLKDFILYKQTIVYNALINTLQVQD